MKNFWDERFEQPMYVYGKAPNDFFAQRLNQLTKGRILLPAEGEGRNAVYAAIKGWGVTAFDYSEEGRKKALALANAYDVEIDYQLVKASDFSSDTKFDAVAMIFAHFSGQERIDLCRELENSISKGGHLIMEVFSKSQLGRASGGPKNLDLLYSKEEVKSLFTNIDFLILEETKVMLNEGSHHQGEAAVIRAVGIKM